MTETEFSKCPHYDRCEEVLEEHGIHRERLSWHRWVLLGLVSLGTAIGGTTLLHDRQITRIVEQMDANNRSVLEFINYQKEKDENFGIRSLETMKAALDAFNKENKNEIAIEKINTKLDMTPGGR